MVLGEGRLGKIPVRLGFRGLGFRVLIAPSEREYHHLMHIVSVQQLLLECSVE